MENIRFEIEGNILKIAVDLSQEVGESASGKSMIIGTTGGNVSVPGHEEIKLGVNVYRPVRSSAPARRGW